MQIHAQPIRISLKKIYFSVFHSKNLNFLVDFEMSENLLEGGFVVKNGRKYVDDRRQ